MPTRREAEELARVLALSTQQAREIDQAPPHSLSSERAVPTQDSRDLELKMAHPPTVGTPDEVALFSSRSAEESGHGLDIQSFSLSAQEHPVHASAGPSRGALGDRHAHEPTSGTAASADIARLTATERSPASSSRGPLFTPTQTSNQARPPITYGKADQRTPLRANPNHTFQLSSSPPELVDSLKRQSPPASKAPKPASSQPEIVEVLETTRPKSAMPSSSRSRSRPEIVLQSRKKVGSSKQRDSPDPLDLIPDAGPSSSGDFHPLSSSLDTANKGVERKSSRVQAAAEKKEAEKEEKRRLRRERKAREALLEHSKSSGKKAVPKKTASIVTTRRASPVKAPVALSGEANKVIVTVNPDVPVTLDRHKAPTKKRARLDETEDSEIPVAQSHIPRAEERSPSRAPSVADQEESLPAPVDLVLEDDRPDVLKASALAASPGPPTTKDTVEPPKSDLSRLRKSETVSSPSPRQSPGPLQPNGKPERPEGIRWQTSRDDLSGVLSKFGGARPAGMSKRHRIAPLHAKIGPPAKALPPVPQKPVKKKKGEESDDDDEEGETSEDEEGNEKVKSKKKGIEWFMMED